MRIVTDGHTRAYVYISHREMKRLLEKPEHILRGVDPHGVRLVIELVSDDHDPLTDFDPEREFLAASIAVWRQVDRLTAAGPYPGIPPDDELRQHERIAWERYRDEVLDA